MYPFHIPLSLELCIPFSCCKFTLNFEWINHKTITFSQLFHSDKNNHMMRMSALLGLSYRLKITGFRTLSCTWNFYLFMYLKPKKWYPFGGGGGASPNRPLLGVTREVQPITTISRILMNNSLRSSKSL